MVRALFSSVYATMVGENYFQIYSFQIAGKYICEPPSPPPPPPFPGISDHWFPMSNKLLP